MRLSFTDHKAAVQYLTPRPTSATCESAPPCITGRLGVSLKDLAVNQMEVPCLYALMRERVDPLDRTEPFEEVCDRRDSDRACSMSSP